MDLRIHQDASQAMLLVRHGHTYPYAAPASRTLTAEGESLCAHVWPFWQEVIVSLRPRFSSVWYHAGSMPSAILTAFLIFKPQQLITGGGTVVVASMKRVDGGAWFMARQAEGLSRIEIMRAAKRDPAVWTGQRFEAEAESLRHTIQQERSSQRLTVIVSGEPAMSFALMDLIPDAELGFAPCEGVLVGLTNDGCVLSGQKLVPPA